MSSPSWALIINFPLKSIAKVQLKNKDDVMIKYKDESKHWETLK
jgi:hypothetical protein